MLRTTPHLACRADPATLPEQMDQPCSYPEFRDCIRGIGRVNRLTLAYGPTLRFLGEATARARRSPLRVLDVGSGGGDTLHRIARWARRHGEVLDLTGIDLNPHATRAAEELSAAHPPALPIAWRTGDVFTDPGAQGADLVLSALVTHHMRDDEIIEFLRWMERTARTGWFINDLLRSAQAYRFFQIFSRTLRLHPFVQHDGLVSIRRGFRTADWQRLLTAAEVPLAAVRIAEPIPGRLCVTRLR